ncbi:hypothetical protein [Streptomyces ureilyticus]|uniref:Uncharacterized protein n=1 Tax=Streptomyces ureilyticus TaxID=1775131 RepID=A0ABX0DXC4_9ACTN|nr:hypothetical protein [Streptomyces ureilyticus]NGO46585.1 hypothetical protein [Streptomyces ureilyticus]
MPTISFEELGSLTGEMLPERSVLSTMVPLGGHGGGDGVGVAADSSSAAVAEGGDAAPRGVISTSACQAVNNMGSPGSLVNGGPALGALFPNSSFTCIPATTAVY